jgi:uncharacterized protein CbrC (UPF0167 family)
VAHALPRFKYDPGPVATGAIVLSDELCMCCTRRRGYIYSGSVFAVRGGDLRDRICPWCIADGSAARRFSARFNCNVGGDCVRFIQRGPNAYDCLETEWDAVSREITREIEERTPGFSSYQTPKWWTHCRDGAAFLGYVGELPHQIFSEPEAREFALRTREQWELSESDWQWYITSPDDQHGFTTYVFRCLHCRKLGGFADCS